MTAAGVMWQTIIHSVFILSALGIPFHWAVLPLFVLAYFGGQAAGARWRAHSAQPKRP